MPNRLDGKPRYTRPVEDRFWRGVNKNGPLLISTRCWVWTRARTKDGYGSLWIKNKADYPHRYSFELHNGPLPPGMRACHHCDNPPCVNPEHLFAGTDKDNRQDSVRKGRTSRIGPRANPEIVRTIRRLGLTDMTQSQIGAVVGMGKASVRRILKGYTWSSVQ